jgi:hypothetical protein
MLPSGLTAGWSMIEPSEWIQRDSPVEVTDSRKERLREKYTEPSGATLGGDIPFAGDGK